MKYKKASSDSETPFTAPDEDRVPRDAAALIFHPSGSYELWIPKEGSSGEAVSRGAVLAAALSVAMETDPTFLEGVFEKFKARIDAVKS